MRRKTTLRKRKGEEEDIEGLKATTIHTVAQLVICMLMTITIIHLFSLLSKILSSFFMAIRVGKLFVVGLRHLFCPP